MRIVLRFLIFETRGEGLLNNVPEYEFMYNMHSADASVGDHLKKLTKRQNLTMCIDNLYALYIHWSHPSQLTPMQMLLKS